MTTGHIIKAVTEVINREDENLVFAYIFGSLLTPNFDVKRSDIDLGIYFRKDLNMFHTNEIKFKIQDSLQKNIGVDIVQMQRKDLIINNQILSNGQLIINRDPDLLFNFRLYQWSQYVDFKFARRKLEEGLAKPVLKKRQAE